VGAEDQRPSSPLSAFLPARQARHAAIRAACAALAGAVLEWTFNGLALFVLLRDPAAVQFAPFLVVFFLGSILSAAAGAPGGIGVFEAVVLTLSSHSL